MDLLIVANLSFLGNVVDNEGCYNRLQMRIQSFPPVICSEPKVLVLGSMPGRRSLEMHEYYAHPRNLFWLIMGEICKAGPDLPYPERLAVLQNTGIALWDVLQVCDRVGSLDGNIRTESEVANDLPALLASYPSIQAIGFNGGKAWLAFRRLVQPVLNPNDRKRLELVPLPSTSPANAGISFEEKLKRWGEIRLYLKI
jgi:double-stranded uracil-DNA glycosylase